MKNYLCVIYFTLICLKVGAENKDTATVKLGGSNALANIANQAATNTENDSQRVANIFYWVAHNIQFDTKAFNKSEKIKYRTSKEILKSKKANATEYATLMKDLCELVGVKAMVILGYEKKRSV
jgi:transglutaminase/protease-like cytokinesis protein 3